MSGKEFLLVILGAVLADNLVFEGFMGLPAVLGEEKCSKKALFTGLWVAVIMLLSQAIFYPVAQLLAAKSMAYLSELAAAAIILALVYVDKLIMPEKMGDGFVLVALNSAVLGLCLMSMTEDAGFAGAMIKALGAALGFLAAELLFAGVRSRIDEKQVPAPFRGTPVLLLAAAILAMALSAYK